jgi:hypothetical protein
MGLGRRWVPIGIAAVAIVVFFPSLAFLLVPVALFFILVLATGSGTKRTGSGDRRLLRPERDRSTGQLINPRRAAFRGSVAAVVAATGLAGLVSFGADGRSTALVLVVALGYLVATGGATKFIRDGLYLGIGVGATALTLQSLLIGDCSGAMPSQTAALLTLVPVMVMGVAAVAGGLRRRELPSLATAGALALAAFAVVEFGTIAVAPAGLRILEGAPVWTPLVLLAILSFIAALVGLQPEFGADAAALGLLALTAFFFLFDTPCGLQFGDLVVVTGAFVTGMILAGFLRRGFR